MSETTQQHLLAPLFEPGSKYRDLTLADVIGDGRTRNTLLRNGYRTISDLENIIYGGTCIKEDLTERCVEKTVEALMRLQGEPIDEYLGRIMFRDMLGDYDDIQIRWIDLFTKDRRISSKLVYDGYKRIGNLRSVSERTLEMIVGNNMMSRLYNLEKTLLRSPEENLSEIWMADFSSRRGTIMLRQARGEKRKDIAADEGVSVERIRQMTGKFLHGQQGYLEIIDKKLSRSKDKEAELKKLFPYEDCRNTFLLWQIMESRVHRHFLTKEEWIEKNVPHLKQDKDSP